MANSVREVKSLPPLRDWSQVRSFACVYVPLAGAATLLAIFGFGVPASTALAGLAAFAIFALIAIVVAAYEHSRRIAEQLESVSDAVRQMSAAEFDKWASPGTHLAIEELAVSLDRTQSFLKLRLAELEASRDQLQTVLNSMVEGVIAIDSSQRVLLVNEAAGRLFPIPSSSSGRPLWELVRSPQLH